MSNSTASQYQQILQEWCNVSDVAWKKSSLKNNLMQAIVPLDNGIDLCVEVGGNPKNPPLVMIMGLGSQMIFWPDELIDKLIEANFFIIRFDNRDSGHSSQVKLDKTPNPPVYKMIARMQVGLSNSKESVAYNLEDMSKDVQLLIQKLNLTNNHTRKVSLIGASMGGMIAQILAAKSPKLVDKLILLFTSTNRPLLPPPKPKQLKALFSVPKSNELEDVLEHSIYFINTIGTKSMIDEKKVREVAKLRYERCRNPLGSRQQFIAILATGSVRKYSKKIKAATLVMHGSKDGLLPPANGRDVAKSIKRAKFVSLDGMGHDLPAHYHDSIVNNITKHFAI